LVFLSRRRRLRNEDGLASGDVVHFLFFDTVLCVATCVLGGLLTTLLGSFNDWIVPFAYENVKLWVRRTIEKRIG
jgi:hypothetical protein